MSDQQVYFHYTIGPVQSFVAQARRTRDFWAGSFILSWLSAVAVREVVAQCGSDDAIQFPKPETSFLAWLDGTNTSDEDAPQQGSIPNRFKAVVDKKTFNPDNVSKAVRTAWIALADEVYRADFQNERMANNQIPDRTLWERQINHCWELVWSYSDVPASEKTNDIPVLDQRKQWRTYIAPSEPRVKCMMMEGWQELSGVKRPNAKLLENFWEPLRASSNTMASDIRENEYLCAIAFVKRRFPRHFGNLIDLKDSEDPADRKSITMPTNWSAHGWKVEEGRPSVSYMAAAHWWEATLLQAKTSKQVEHCVGEFYEAASTLTAGSHGGNHPEWNTSIRCIDEATDNKKWRALDGDVFFETVLGNTALYTTKKKQDQAKLALNKLNALKRELVQVDSASPFYAVLMMDGDSLGKQMKVRDHQQDIAEGLQLFTKAVQGVVKDHHGFLVYAGGDDVLALLPTEDALRCALAVRERYEKIFKRYPKIKTSISAAIEYAHIRMPLMKVLKDAHRLLDDVAKDKTGRDALAVRVWKPGGMALEWAQKWDIACDETTGTKRVTLDRLSKEFYEYQIEHDPQGQFSNKFFYKIHERLALFNPAGSGNEAKPSELTLDEAISLMAVEYATSGLCEDIKDKAERLDKAWYRVEPLLAQCKSANGRYNADAALLLRFLAQKGVGA